MSIVNFDPIEYFEKLKAAGVSEAQAKIQADMMRVQADMINKQAENQNAVLQADIKRYIDASQKEFATKGDIQDIHKEIQDVRKEIQDIRYEMQRMRNEIEIEILSQQTSLLKWLLYGLIVLLAINAFLKS